MIHSPFKHLLSRHEGEQQADIFRSLIHHEAVIGGELFGPVEPNHRREFFCLDDHTWVWHEEWTDDMGELFAKTTRYDVRTDGIYKAQEGQEYGPASDTEVFNLANAVELYLQRVGEEIYAPAA